MRPTSATATVLRAVSQGVRESEAIAGYTGLDLNHARTCLRRLRDKGYIRVARYVGHPGGRKGMGKHAEYEPVGVNCILANVWPAL
jgi:hypothetical protein